MKKIVVMLALISCTPFIAAHKHKHPYVQSHIYIKNRSNHPITIAPSEGKTINLAPNKPMAKIFVRPGYPVRITAHLQDHDITKDFVRSEEAERVWYVHVYHQPGHADMSLKIEKTNSNW